MALQLLRTRTRTPPRQRRLIERSWLVERLEREIVYHKLVVVSAPAGYGKTTLLGQWARATRLPVAWLSLAAGDDPDDFFRYVLAAWEVAQPGVAQSPLGMLLRSASVDMTDILHAFLRLAEDVTDDLVFLIDDFHLIEDAAVDEALTFILEHLPPTVHFVLASRAAPSLPLARHRARGELLELGVSDLQFRLSETETFLNQVMELRLTSDQLSGLSRQLEGWVAGIQLVALSLAGKGSTEEPLAVSGRHRFIADYLGEDVLAHQSDAVREFLLKTSILDRLCAPLCNAVVGRDDGQYVLEAIQRENLFLVPLDDNREWYRFHGLIRDYLIQELNRQQPDEVPELHRRAARWYLEFDSPEPAFDQALASHDLELTIQVSERFMIVKLHGGEFNRLRTWLEALPADWYAAYPGFGLVRAGLLAFSGDLDSCVRTVDDVEQRLVDSDTTDTAWLLARVTAMRCFVACFQNDLEGARSLATEALDTLPEDDLSFRADIYHALGDTYRRNSRWDEAERNYRRVLDFHGSPTFRVLSPHIFGALADLQLRQGRLRDAAGYWEAARSAIEDQDDGGRIDLPVIGWVYIRMGEILYEWNDLALASDHLSRGLELAELGGDVRALIAGYLMMGRLRLTEGEVEAAEEWLERARPLMHDATFPEWSSRFERLQVDIWLAKGSLVSATQWAEEMGASAALINRPESEAAQLAVAQALILKRDSESTNRALRLLETLITSSESDGRMGVHIEALALTALASWQRGDKTAAMTTLERALRVAQPEGYVRLFADLGNPMVPLLQEASSRQVARDYVTYLLTTIGDDLSSGFTLSPTLAEPLTPREREILTLVAAGLTNGEIADELIISPQTVKKHAGNIYGKLGVRSRTEAASRARSLGLLP